VTEHEDAYIADPHRIRTVVDVDYLFKRSPGECRRVTCDYCDTTARRNFEHTRRWFLEHDCNGTDRKQLRTVSKAREQALEREEADRRFWLETACFHLPDDDRLVDWLVEADARLEDAASRSSQATPVFDELAARRTMKEVQVQTDLQHARDAERLAEIAHELFVIAARLQARFPSSQIISTTVDRFIEAALEGSTSLPRAA
jgi:hypothetical protein